MKVRVIGWVYPYYNFEMGQVTWSVRNAIIDEIRKRGYDFDGDTHQDDACTPVLNNGKKYLFSTRGWGDLMAEAKGYTGCMDYTAYAFSLAPRKQIVPEDANEFDMYLYHDEYDFEEAFQEWKNDGFYEDGLSDDELRELYRSEQNWMVPETDLNERFEVAVSREECDRAQSNGVVKLSITPELRYLDAGDTLALKCGEETREYTVVDVVRQRDLPKEKFDRLLWDMRDHRDREKAKRAQDELDSAQMILMVKIKL